MIAEESVMKGKGSTVNQFPLDRPRLSPMILPPY